MKALYILLFLAAAMFMATASAEIVGQAVSNNGNIAYTATAALGGDVDLEAQDADAHGDDATASQTIDEAEGEQVVAVTGAITAEGDTAMTVAAVQDGEIEDTTQSAEADDGVAEAEQTANVEGEAGFAFTTAEDCMGDSATTEAGFVDGEMTTSQGAAAGELEELDNGEEAAVAYTGVVGTNGDPNTIGTTIEADSGFVATYAEDRFGATAGTYIEAEGGRRSDALIETIQGAEAGESAGVHFTVDHSPFVINTVKGADAFQISHAEGKEIEAGSFAADPDGAASVTEIEVEGGRRSDATLDTFQVAGADLFKTGVYQASSATGRETETITEADNGRSWRQGLKKVVIEGESWGYNGNVVTEQGATTSSFGPFSSVEAFSSSTPGAFTNWDSETTTVFAREHDVDEFDWGVGAGDTLFQAGWVDWDDGIISVPPMGP